MSNIQALLSVDRPSEYSNLSGVEYLFNEVQENGALEEVLAKFPRDQVIEELIRSQVLSYDLLYKGWIKDVLQEINGLIYLLPDHSLAPLSKAELSSVDFESDETFKLNGEMNKLFRKISDRNLDSHERAFLRDFFYGVDFTHWTKWAILLHYTDVNVRLPVVLRARRNGVRFSIRGETLVYSAP